MIKRPNTKAQRVRRHQRVRGKVSGTAERPRLSVFRSENNIYAQIIDDVAGKTLCSASTVEKGFEAMAATAKRQPRSASSSASVPWQPVLPRSCSTAAATCTMAVSRLWQKAPVRAA